MLDVTVPSDRSHGLSVECVVSTGGSHEAS